MALDAAKLQTAITNLEDAIAAFTGHDVQSYTLADGRSVTRNQLGDLVAELKALNELAAQASAQMGGTRRNYARLER